MQAQAQGTAAVKWTKTQVWANGDRYEGEYRDGKRNGQGNNFYANGHGHEGEYRDDKMHGQSKFFWANGDRYEGEYRDGKKHGQGTFITYFSNHRAWSYTGTLVKDRPTEGVLTEADGRRFDVTYASDCANIEKVPAPKNKELIEAAAAGLPGVGADTATREQAGEGGGRLHNFTAETAFQPRQDGCWWRPLLVKSGRRRLYHGARAGVRARRDGR